MASASDDGTVQVWQELLYNQECWGATYRSIHHREYVFIQAHLACVDITFTVLFRLFRRFHADTDLVQTSIAGYAGCTCNFVLDTYDMYAHFFQQEMIHVSYTRTAIEELVG